MDSIRVLLTGGGSPGFLGTFKSLIHNYDKRQIDIITVDANEDVIGKLYCKFYQIPKATETNYLERISEIYLKERIDVILPQNTAELEILSESGLNVCVSKRVKEVNDKYSLINLCKEIGVPYPETRLVNNKDDLLKACYEFDYPYETVVVKPPKANGSRGVRLIDDVVDYKQMFYEDKINSFISMKHLLDTLGNEFPDLLVQEYLGGDEFSVDCFRGNRFIAVPRLRQEIKNGISWRTKTVNDENLIEYSKRISESLDLKYAFGFQFKRGKILECNPRVQGTMIASTFAGANVIYSAVKYAMGEDVPELLVDWGAELKRFWGFKPC